MLRIEAGIVATPDTEQQRRRARRLAIKLALFAFVVYVGYIFAFIANRS